MNRIIIAAIARNRVIGKSEGAMSWHVPAEFKHFKSTTMGFPIILGRKTYEVLGKPLPGRPHFIISKSRSIDSITAEITSANAPAAAIPIQTASDIEEALQIVEQTGSEKVYIIGGAQVYRYALEHDLVDEMLLSFMHFDAVGDVYFPAYNEQDWDEISWSINSDSADVRNHFTVVLLRKKR